MTMQRITIDPITRLEGHGKIEIFLDAEGNVANTYFRFPSCAASSASAWDGPWRRCRS